MNDLSTLGTPAAGALAAALAIGLSAGSYAATAALRAVRGEPSLAGRSHCDACGVALGYLETAPVISYLRRRGACRECRAAIDPVHPVGEIAGGLVVLAAALLLPLPQAVVVALLGLVLTAASVVDLKVRRLPDALTAAAAGLCGLQAWLSGGVNGLTTGAASAIAALVLLGLLRRGFAAVRGVQGLGAGDVKLIAALALWLGPATALAVCGASALGLAAVAWRTPADGRLAFGPFIAAAGLITGLMTEAWPWP